MVCTLCTSGGLLLSLVSGNVHAFFIIIVMFMTIGRTCHTIVDVPLPYPLRLHRMVHYKTVKNGQYN